jgi:hypothetical protein
VGTEVEEKWRKWKDLECDFGRFLAFFLFSALQCFSCAVCCFEFKERLKERLKEGLKEIQKEIQKSNFSWNCLMSSWSS